MFNKFSELSKSDEAAILEDQGDVAFYGVIKRQG